MKLFENGVGRPSNEIKRKRKIFIASVSATVILVILLTSVLLFGNNILKLKGLVKSNVWKFESKIIVSGNEKKKTIKLTSEEFGSNVKKIRVVACTTEDKCKKDTAYDDAKSNAKGVISSKTGTDYLVLETSYVTFKTYYIRIESLDSHGDRLVSAVYEIRAKKAKKANEYEYTWGDQLAKQDYTKLKDEDKEAKFDVTSIRCSSKACKTKIANVVLKSFGDAVKKVAYVICEDEQTCRKTDAYDIMYDKNKKSALKFNAKKDTITSVKLTTEDGNIANQKYYFRISTYDKNGKKIYEKLYQLVTAKESTQSKGNTVYITSENPLSDSTNKTLKLECPATGKTNEAFKCTVNQTGVKITVGGAKSLASGYSSTFTTTSGDKAKDIKYADKLFTDYKSIIKKDSNGKEYINATIKATKSGYTTVKKVVKIYKGTSSSKVANINLELQCPAIATVDTWFHCVSNLSGVKITNSNQYFSGAVLTFTTTSSDKVKDLRYNKTGTITVTASKSGYKTVTKKVKIVDYATNTNSIELYCPSVVNVDYWFQCTTNLPGVKITASNKNFTGNVLTFTTTSSDKVKDLRYSKAGTITITASKSGYKTVTKNVIVK